MVTFVDEATDRVVTVKVAVLVFAATVTLAGTVAAEVVELASVTTAPPGGALPVNVTVPVEGVPPTTLVGLTETVEFAAGVTVSEAVFGTEA
jgi:hypothetical protein